MTLLLVPNFVRDAINAAINRELDGRPIADDERENLYRMLLSHYDEHGEIPEFSLTARNA